MPAFVPPWINGMTEVVQFASVSSMTDSLPICAHLHTHNFTQTGRQARIILTPVHTYVHDVMHIQTVE